MALNASKILGSDQTAGVRVNNRGYGKTLMSGSRGMAGGTMAGGAASGVGGAIGSVLMSRWASKRATAERAEAVASTAPRFGKLAFLALTQNELALIDMDVKTTAKLTTVLARVARSEVTSVQMAKAGPLMAKPLTVMFANGERWLLEVPALMKRDGRKLVRAFG